MNASPAFLHRTCELATLKLLLIGTLVLSGCTNPATPSSATDASSPTLPSSTTDTLTPIESQPNPIESIADDIAKDVGRITQISEGDPNRMVIVFEETHNAPAGQVEIAIMINRLYEHHGLRFIGLEGSFAADGNLTATWFDPSLESGQVLSAREDVAVQLLEDGEISSSEMMALVYSDVNVAGIENAEEYNYEPPDEAWSAPTIYLYLIAAPGLSQDEIAKANDLINADKVLEGIEFIISTDEWANEKYELMNDDTIIISAEQWLQMLDEIETKAEAVGAELSQEDKDAMQALQEFYQRASNRSKTMVEYTLSLLDQSTGKPVAMIIGAAHTELTAQILTEQGISFAVIRGNSLAENRENGDLHYQAYERKTLSDSVDPVGTLGALLNGRKKPQPVINQTWFQSKSNIFLLTDSLARAAAGGEKPPFTATLGNLPQLEGVTLDQGSIKVDGDDVIFSVTALDKNGNSITIWVRTRASPSLAKTLEERLREALAHIEGKDAPNYEVEESVSSEPVLTRVSSETVAKFTTSKAEIATATLEK